MTFQELKRSFNPRVVYEHPVIGNLPNNCALNVFYYIKYIFNLRLSIEEIIIKCKYDHNGSDLRGIIRFLQEFENICYSVKYEPEFEGKDSKIYHLIEQVYDLHNDNSIIVGLYKGHIDIIKNPYRTNTDKQFYLSNLFIGEMPVIRKRF